MPVIRRNIRSLEVCGVPCLGAVEGDGAVWLWLPTDFSTRDVRARFGASMVELAGMRRALRARVAAEGIDAAPRETALFAGRKVLVALRNGERTEAVADWLHFHAAEQGADAALIFDRTEEGDPEFCGSLDTDLPILIVTTDLPMGQRTGPDLRAPLAAPAVARQASAPQSAWHSPCLQLGYIDLIRQRFLADAQAVAFVDIADLLPLLTDGETVFDRALSYAGSAVALSGVESYPWRLRQGAPAPHFEHIATRRMERRRLRSWAIAPANQPAAAFWRPAAPFAVPMAETAPYPFVRAMGVVYPGAPVNRIVRKADLREQPNLLALMRHVFDAEPLRLPAPAAIPPRPKANRVAIVTAMKNEGPFILDWVAHNRAIGIKDCLVYTNDCDDGSDHLLSLLAEAGVSHRANPYRAMGKVPQHAAFRAAEDEPLVQEADWLMTLDVDEYLNIHSGQGTVTDLFDALPAAHAVSVPWRMFGNADRHGFIDQPVTEQFTRCAPEYAPRPLQAWAFKTLYRNEGLFRRLGVHRPKGLAKGFRDTLVWVDATGTPLPPVIWDKAWRMSKAHWGYTHATVNHYAVRSAESFLVKRDRGKVNRTKREQGLAYWFRMNHNAEEDHSIQRFAARVAAERASLMALPGVRAAYVAAVAWHRARIAELRSDPDNAALFEQITSPRMQNLSRIATNFGANVHLVGPDVIPDDIAMRAPGEPFYWTVKLSEASKA
ncbi:MAG: glycosyltransferase family 2 protein [Pseudomonadota bacterium]